MAVPSLPKRVAAWSLVLCAAGCGRIGFDEIAPPLDALPDAVRDASDDATSGIVDRGVLVRYLLNEGSAVGPVVSSASPLNLAFNPVATAISAVSESTGAGFAFPESGNSDRLCGPVPGGAIEMLNGGTTGTIEVVADLVDGIVAGSRVAAVTESNTWGFSIGFRGLRRQLVFSMNQTTIWYGEWSDMPTGRHVFTVVLDVDSRVVADRLKLYIDGAPGAINGGVGINGDEIVSFGAVSQLCIGNRGTGSRGLLGRVYYAAYYSSALSAGEVSSNAALLLENDD